MNRFFRRIDGRQTTWYVVGEHGAVQFQIMLMPNVTDVETVDAKLMGWALTDAGWVMATDLGFHWRHPVDFGSHFEHCPAFGEEEECWYDGSSLAADPIMSDWVAAGFDDEVIHRALEEHYDYQFGGVRG